MIPHFVNGLPLHPLVVHIPVVLVPLTSLGLIAIVLVPRWRATYGLLIAGTSVVAFLGTGLAFFSGKNFLRDRGFSGDLIQRHEHLGETMPWFALALSIVAIGYVVLVRRGAAKNVLLVVGILAIVVAGVTTAELARVGDAGAKSVFGTSG